MLTVISKSAADPFIADMADAALKAANDRLCDIHFATHKAITLCGLLQTLADQQGGGNFVDQVEAVSDAISVLLGQVAEAAMSGQDEVHSSQHGLSQAVRKLTPEEIQP